MSEEIIQEPVSPEQSNTALESLARQVSRLRVWVAVLTAIFGLLVLGALGAFGLFLTTGAFLSGMDGQAPDGSAIEKQIREAYGTELEDVDVRGVKSAFGAPFPFSLLEGGPEDTYAVTYKLKGAETEFATVYYSGMTDMEGLVPPRSALVSRMDTPELLSLLKAYAHETKSPAGGVVRYSQSIAQFETPAASNELTITVSGKDYATANLWIVSEGTVVKGDKAPADWDMERQGYVFARDPKSGAFTFVGNEPYSGIY